MLGIQIGTEFLELPEDASLEMERANPFLQFNEAITGEYSLPLAVSLTPKNLKLLNYAGLLQVRPDTKGVDAIAYDDGLQHSSGKLKVEKIDHNLNRTAAGTASLYYLTGISAFYQDAKNVKLRACDFGGDRVFPFDSFDRNSTGFWGHIHRVIDAAPASYDYAFYPVIDKQWTGSDTIQSTRTDVLNAMGDNGGVPSFRTLTTDESAPNVLIPFPYLVYVLQQAIAKVGWRIEAPGILDDPDFKKITMLNFQALDWSVVDPKLIILGPVTGGTYSGNVLAHDSVTINLRNHVPDITIVDFLIALKNRFAWRYDFDTRKKILRIGKLQSLIGNVFKDYTYQASPLLSKKVLSEKKIYSLKNNFTGEYAATPPVFPSGSKKGEVNMRSELPAPVASNYNFIYLVRTENNWYICRQDTEHEDTFFWDIYAYNIYDVVPDGATDEITTAATTIGVERYDAYLSLAPRNDQSGIWPGYAEQDVTWGIELLFYHGLQLNEQNQLYPFASNHIYNAQGLQVGNWSLAFEGKTRDGADVGLYNLNWKTFLDAINTGEELEVTLYLPRHEYMKLQFSDIIVIKHVRMFIKKIKHTVPYGKKVTLECSRI
jgi:hypothetical protein